MQGSRSNADMNLFDKIPKWAAVVSGVAALPRIVTLHDITLAPDPADDSEDLIMDVTAKTYRYLDEETE